MGEELFLNVEQIIPTQDAEDYMIGMAEKAQDDIDSQTKEKTRHVLRREFWSKLLPIISVKTPLFQNINPGVYHWIGAGSGVRGLGLNFAAAKSYGRAELYIDRGEREENKRIFDELYEIKAEIEKHFGSELIWERLDDKRACRIKSETEGNVFDKDTWDEMIAFMVDAMMRLEIALKEPLININKKLKSGIHP